MDGPRADGWRFDVASPMTVQVDLTSTSFDALLLVTDPLLEPVAYDDDGGTGLDSRLVHTFEAGSYIIWATSFGTGGTGAYRISLQEVPVIPCATADPVGQVTLGRTVNGTLQASDCRLEEGAFADPWRLGLSERAAVQIDLTSTEFDAFLIVDNVSGTRIAFDDDGGGGFNSRLVLTLEPGNYTLWASSLGPGQTGPYEMSIRAASGVDAHRGGVVVPAAVPDLPPLADLVRSDKTSLAGGAGESAPPTAKGWRP